MRHPGLTELSDRWAPNRSLLRVAVWRRASTPVHTERDVSFHAAPRSVRLPGKDLERQTSGVECRKAVGVLDEIPGAYKSIEA
jgi:hypothetical protein